MKLNCIFAHCFVEYYMRKILLSILVAVLVASCSPYQKLLKSNDYELKYTKALEYYDAKQYLKANTLFEELVSVFRGSDKAEKVIYTYAESLYKLKDYVMAQYYYALLVKDYPGSTMADEAQFKNAYCYYLISPKPRLDQTDTYNAINEFTNYLSIYPSGSHVDESNKLIIELRDKLVYKSYLNAKLYYNLGNYMGNNYLSAVIAAQNSMKDFPDTKYREELSFLILDSKYIQAMNSVEEKRMDRLRDCLDEYYSFANEFPESTYMKKAKKIYEETSSLLN